jgi:LCP family protein required for cell wall assembly
MTPNIQEQQHISEPGGAENKPPRFSVPYWVVGLALVVVVAAALLWHQNRIKMFFSGQKIVTFLFLGSDEKSHKGRTDTIIVGFYNPRTQKLGFVIVPRDMQVKVRGLYFEKINSVYTALGLAGLKRQLSDLLGYPINYTAVLDLDGFVKLVDIAGPVRIYNDRPLRYVDQAGQLYIDLPEGELELDGEKAMEYVRFRADERGDIGRSERQLEIIQQVVKKVLLERDMFRNVRVLRTIVRYFKTDISFGEVLWLLRQSSRFKLSNIESMKVPGVFKKEKGEDYIVVDPDSVRARVREFVLRLNTVDPRFDPTVITVQVLNGCDTPGLAAKVRNRLLYFGYNVVEFGNADHHGYAKTYVLDRSGNRQAADKIAEIIHCENVFPKINKLLLVDVTVIIGGDFDAKK